MSKKDILNDGVVSVKFNSVEHTKFKIMCLEKGIKKGDVVRYCIKKFMYDVDFFNDVKANLG